MEAVCRSRQEEYEWREQAKQIAQSRSLRYEMWAQLGMLEARKEMPEAFGAWTEENQKRLEQMKQLAREVRRQQEEKKRLP